MEEFKMKKALNIAAFFVVTLAVVVAVFAGDKSEFKTVNLEIEGMTCNGCVNKVQTELKKVEGVTNTEVVLAENAATVTFNSAVASEDALKDAVKKAGFTVKTIKSGEKGKSAKSATGGCCGGSSCVEGKTSKKSI